MGGMTRLLLLLWVGVTVSTVVDLQKRIIGGHNCINTERLYHVKLTDENNNFVCGGTLITDQWILTAAHCWTWGMTAVVGVHPGPGRPPEPITIPPVIFGDDKGIHDIMLLKLRTPITQIRPVQPPDCGNGRKPTIGVEVQIAGHASVTMDPITNRRQPGEVADLQCANINVVNCPWHNPLQIAHAEAHQHMFCGRTPGVDTCSGDSGGGVVYNDRIYGVISTNGADYACIEEAGFMDVCGYMKWIKDTTARSLLNKIKGCFGCI